MTNKPIIPPKTTLDHVVDAISAGLQTAPFIGGIAQYLDEYYPNQQKRWLNELTETLRANSQAIDIIKCDIEHFGALLNEALFYSLQTSSALKREAFRAILLNCASGKTADIHEIDFFMSTAGSLSELQIEMLKRARPATDDRHEKIESKLNDYFPESTLGMIRASYLDLVQKGLVWQPYRNTYRDLVPVPMDIFQLTTLGESFLAWIKHEE